MNRVRLNFFCLDITLQKSQKLVRHCFVRKPRVRYILHQRCVLWRHPINPARKLAWSSLQKYTESVWTHLVYRRITSLQRSNLTVFHSRRNARVKCAGLVTAASQQKGALTRVRDWGSAVALDLTRNQTFGIDVWHGPHASEARENISPTMLTHRPSPVSSIRDN